MQLDWGAIWNYVSSALGILGVLLTMYFGWENRQLSRSRNRFGWSEVQQACQALGSGLASGFRPEVIVCFSGPSAIVANLTIALGTLEVPVVLISCQRKVGASNQMFVEIPNSTLISSSKWNLFVPNQLFELIEKRVCILEDAIISGDSLFLLKSELLTRGFEDKRIWTCAVVCTDIAREANKAPNEGHFIIENSNFYFPWGKGG